VHRVQSLPPCSLPSKPQREQVKDWENPAQPLQTSALSLARRPGSARSWPQAGDQDLAREPDRRPDPAQSDGRPEPGQDGVQDAVYLADRDKRPAADERRPDGPAAASIHLAAARMSLTESSGDGSASGLLTASAVPWSTPAGVAIRLLASPCSSRT
jgi:hypothetical protein